MTPRCARVVLSHRRRRLRQVVETPIELRQVLEISASRLRELTHARYVAPFRLFVPRLPRPQPCPARASGPSPRRRDKGFSAEDGWNGDAAHWEIFEHHRRLHAIARLVTTLSTGSEADRLATCELPAARSAWERTQEMQTMYLAIIAAVTADADTAT